MPLSYRQVKDLYDTLADAKVVTKSLPEWSTEMNGLTGSDMYSEGLNDNLIKRASVGIDRGLEAIPGLIPAGEAVGRGVGGLFGMGEEGAAIGADLPRMTVNFLPMLAAGALTGGAAPLIAEGAGLLGGAGLAATAGLSGADTYTKTGSPAAGLVSAGMAAAFPAIAGAGEQATLRMLGGRKVAGTVADIATDLTRTANPRAVSQYFANGPLQSAGAFLGGQAAAFGASEGATMAQEALSGEPIHNPLSPESLLGLGISQLPFAAMHGAGKLFNRTGHLMGEPQTVGNTTVQQTQKMNQADLLEAAIAQTGRAMTLKKAKEDLAAKTDIEKVPVVAPIVASPETMKKTAELLGQLRGEEAKILSKEELTADDAEKLKELGFKQASLSVNLEPTDTSILGAEQDASSDKIQLIGKEVGKQRPKSRTILVSDHPDNPPEFRGKHVNYSKGFYETLPVNREGGTLFHIPVDYHTVLPERTPEQIAASRPLRTPKEGVPAEPDVDFLTALDQIEQKVSVAQTPAEMQKAVGDLQRLKQQANLPDLTDKKLKAVVKMIADTGLVEDPVKAATRAEAAKTKRQLANKAQEVERQAHSEEYLLDLEKRRIDVDHPDHEAAKAISNLRENFANRSGRYETIVSSGYFDEVAARWEKEGGTNLEELKGHFAEPLATGRGLKKVVEAPDPIQVQVKGNPDAVPVRNIMAETATKAVETEPRTVEAAHSIWDANNEYPLDGEKRLFQEWVDQNGGIHEEDIPEMVEYLKNRGGAEVAAKSYTESEGQSRDISFRKTGNEQELKSELTNFLERPHVKIWRKNYEKMIKEAKEKAPMPTVVPKDAKTQLNDALLEALKSKEGAEAYKTSERSKDSDLGKASPLDFEKRQFLDWVKEKGGFHEEDIPDVAKFFADRDGIDPTLAEADLKDFYNSPHAQAWKTKFESGSTGANPRMQAPRDESSFLPAGGPFVWSLAPYDPKTNRIGGKHTLPKDGTIMVGQLKAIGGREKFLNDTEINMMRAVDSAVGGGAFDGDKVNVKKLDQVLRDNPVTVESHTYGMEGKVSEAKAKFDQMTHEWLETLPALQRHVIDLAIRNDNQSTLDRLDTPDTQENYIKALEYHQLKSTIDREGDTSGPRATSYYKTISPFNTEKFPVIRVDVTIPFKQKTLTAHNIADPENARVVLDPRDKPLWKEDNLHENLPNTLGWAMGQIVPHNGEDIFYIGEQQSRWGQERQKDEAQKKGYTITQEGDSWKLTSDRTGRSVSYDTRAELDNFLESKGNRTPSHPLLESQHILVLKAVIAHLEEINAERVKEGKPPITKVGISDGESGMMTEGHDKAAERIVKYEMSDGKVIESRDGPEDPQGKYYLQNGAKVLSDSKTISQNKGMRLHYDITLPSAMRKLTGEKGEMADLGTHKNAKAEGPRGMVERQPFELENSITGEVQTFPTQEAAEARRQRFDTPDNWVIQRNAALDNEGKLVGSPVFKNPDGSPKTNATGLVFEVSKAFANHEAQGGFTLGDPARAPRESEPYIPTTPKAAFGTANLTGDGHAILSPLLKSQFPEHVKIANELIARFPEALKMIESKVTNGASASETFPLDARRVSIEFEPSIANTSPLKRETTILHEVIHGLTFHELINEANPLRKQIEEIRIRAIKSLSPEMREAFRKAKATDWMSTAANDRTLDSWNSLAPTPEARQIIYGLLNEFEFTAQAFSSASFRTYLKQVPGQASGWKSFVASVRSALGLSIKENALSELIGVTGQLMKQGEYMTTLQNYGERWFEGLGKGGDYAKIQTERALGLIQEMDQPLSRIEIAQSLTSGEEHVNPKLTLAKQQLDEAFSNNPDESLHMGSILMENNYSPNREGINDLVENAVADGDNLADVLDILPASATNFIFEKLRDHRDVLSMLKAATAERNNGLVNIIDPKLVRGLVTDTLKPIEKILKQQERHMEMARDLSKLAAVEPRVLVDQYLRAPREVDEFIDETKALGGKFAHGLAYSLEPIGQKVRRLPEAAEITTKMFQLVPNARRMVTERLKPLAADMTNPNIDVVDAASLKANEKIIGNPKLLSAIDKWMQANQVENRDSAQLLDESHPKIATILQNLTPVERTQVRDMVVKAGKVTQYGHAQNLDMMTQEAAILGAGIIGDATGLRTKDNLALSDTLLRAVIDINDPMKQLLAQQQLQTVQQKLAAQPDTFLQLLEFAKNAADQIKATKEVYDANPYWVTAQRMERYLIRGFKNGKPWLGQASSPKEAREIALKKGISLNKEEPIRDQWKGKEDESFGGPNITPDMRARMLELQQNQLKMLLNRGLLEPDEAQEFLRTSAVGQFLKETEGAQKIGDTSLPPRQLGKGSEDLPFLWNHIAHAQRESTYWSRRLLRAQVKTYLKDPELAGNAQLRSELATHFENLMQPDPQVAQKLTRLASTWFMGFNLASTLVNATQPFVTHVAELTAMSGKPLDSYRRIGRALKEAMGNQFGKREWATEEHERFMRDAALDSERGLSMLDDAEQQEESVAVNFRRQMMKNKTQTVGQKLDSAAGTYSAVGMWTFRKVEQMNGTAALLAAFDYHREMGMSYADAKAKAYEFNHAVNFSGGRAQRPVGAFSGRGNFPRTVAMLGTSLQSYVLGTTFQIARYLQKGLFRPTGAQPHEVFAARKAAIQMLGTQFAAAGLLGLPFASSAIALLNQMFPDLELPKNIRQGVNNFLSSDRENGSVLTDIAMTGVPSMMGWDLQSRLSMGNTLPGTSEINGFQPENLMGPVGNIVKNFVQGTQGWAKGDLSAGSKFLPPSIRKTLDLANSTLTDGGAIRDYQGRPLSSPTLGEQLGRAMGFQPKRLSDQNAAAHMARQSQEIASAREAQDRQELAKEVLRGNFGTVRNVVLQKQQSDKSYNALDAVRSIARSAEEMKFPRDLRREGSLGTAGSRQGLLSSYSNLSPAGPSEEERLSFRMGIERSLGLVNQDQSSVVAAKLMDQLRAQNPNATRAELRAQAQSLLRRSAPGTLASPQE